MPSFVLDASATLAWCFKDEANSWSDAILQRLRDEETARVPAHWPIEVSSGFASALRRKRVTFDEVLAFWEDISQLPIQIEPPLAPQAAKALLGLALQHGLTPYDAAYLELAIRLELPLATLDSALLRIAPLSGITLL